VSRRLRLLPLVQFLLRHRLPEEWAEFVLGDLEEEYHRRRRQSSFEASVWLLRQTLVVPGKIRICFRIRSTQPDDAGSDGLFIMNL
jgi:hypothetical protein